MSNVVGLKRLWFTFNDDVGGIYYMIVTVTKGSSIMDIYSIDKKFLTAEEIKSIENEQRVDFRKKPHGHWKYDLDLSTSTPIYSGDQEHRAFARSALSRFLDAQRSRSGSYEVLLSGIAEAFKELEAKKQYNHILWDRAKTWRTRIDELERNYFTHGISANQLILPNQAVILKIEINKLFSELNRLRDADNQEKDRNYTTQKGEVENLVKEVSRSINWKDARSKLKAKQSELRELVLNPKQRHELLDVLNASFNDLTHRQDEANKEYERECTQNYNRLVLQIRSASLSISETANNADARKRLVDLSKEQKGAKLTHDQRQQLQAELDKAFGHIQSIKDEYDRECLRNFNTLVESLEQIERTAYHTSGYNKELVHQAKDLQARLKQYKLNKKQQDEIWGRISQLIQTQNKERELEQQRYEDETARNFQELRSQVYHAEMSAAHNADWQYIRENLKQVQNEIKQAKLKKEDRQELFDRMQGAFATLKDRQQAEWREGIRRSIDKLQGAIQGLEDSLRRDQEYLSQQEMQMANVRPGRHEDEIRSSIGARIDSVWDRIRSKENKLQDMRYNLNDLYLKLSQ